MKNISLFKSSLNSNTFGKVAEKISELGELLENRTVKGMYDGLLDIVANPHDPEHIKTLGVLDANSTWAGILGRLSYFIKEMKLPEYNPAPDDELANLRAKKEMKERLLKAEKTALDTLEEKHAVLLAGLADHRSESEQHLGLVRLKLIEISEILGKLSMKHLDPQTRWAVENYQGLSQRLDPLTTPFLKSIAAKQDSSSAVGSLEEFPEQEAETSQMPEELLATA